MRKLFFQPTITPPFPSKDFHRGGHSGLGGFAYNLDIQDAAFLRSQFEAVGQLTADVPAYAIHYPREFALLPAVRETILNHLEEEPRPLP